MGVPTSLLDQTRMASADSYGQIVVIDHTETGDPDLVVKLQSAQQEYFDNIQDLFGMKMENLTIGIYGRGNWPKDVGFPYGITNYSEEHQEVFATQQDIKEDIYVPFFVKFISGKLTQEQLDQMAQAFRVEPTDNIKDLVAEISEETAYDQYCTHYGLMNEMGLHAIAQAGLTDRMSPGLVEMVASLIRQTTRSPEDRENFKGMDLLTDPFVKSSERFVWNPEQVIHDPLAHPGPLGVVEYAWYKMRGERDFAMAYAQREGFTQTFIQALRAQPSNEITNEDFVRIVAAASGENLEDVLANNAFLNTLYHDPEPLTVKQKMGKPFRRAGEFVSVAWQMVKPS